MIQDRGRVTDQSRRASCARPGGASSRWAPGPYLETCDRELAAPGAAAGPEIMTGLPGLTPAEQAATRLVAAGRTNRQAAAELYVSVKTAEFHLAHIFTKLGTRSHIGAPPPHLEETWGRTRGPTLATRPRRPGEADRMNVTYGAAYSAREPSPSALDSFKGL